MEVDVTQKLCEEVTRKDTEDNKMKQKVEYQLRPIYYEQCQRSRHICNKEGQKKQPTKV